MGANEALIKARYSKYAKKLYLRLDQFSIYDIERSIRNYGRYATLSYPGLFPDNIRQMECLNQIRNYRLNFQNFPAF